MGREKHYLVRDARGKSKLMWSNFGMKLGYESHHRPLCLCKCVYGYISVMRQTCDIIAGTDLEYLDFFVDLKHVNFPTHFQRAYIYQVEVTGNRRKMQATSKSYRSSYTVHACSFRQWQPEKKLVIILTNDIFKDCVQVQVCVGFFLHFEAAQ